MAFFFDMDNPAVQMDNGRNEKLVIDVESYLQDGVEVDIFLVFNAKREKRTSRKISEKVRADETVSLEVFEGDVLHAVVTGTKEIVAKFDVQKDQLYYKISDQPQDPNEFGVKLQNKLDVDLDIVLIYDAAEKRRVMRELYFDIVPDDDVIYLAYEGDVLQVFVANTDTEVSEIEVKRDQYLYSISQIEMSGSEL